MLSLEQVQHTVGAYDVFHARINGSQAAQAVSGPVNEMPSRCRVGECLPSALLERTGIQISERGPASLTESAVRNLSWPACCVG